MRQSQETDPTTPDTLEVHGERLRLRYPSAADAPLLFQLASDPAVTQFFSWGPYQRQAEAAAWLATLPARRAASVALDLAIVGESDNLVGVTSLSELSRRDRRCVVGTWLGRDYWGTGANQASKALVLALAFGPLRMERLGAYADVRNKRSQSALERLGFVQEGVLRSFHRHADSPRDVVSYSLLGGEWRRSPLAQAPFDVVGSPPTGFVCAARREREAR